MAKLPTNNEEFTKETIKALPAHLLMKIKSFSLLLEHEVEKCESREFEAGDYKWRLIIRPDGLIKSRNEDENRISVYVAIVENDSMKNLFAIMLDSDRRLIIRPDGLIKSRNEDENRISVYVAIVENDSMPIGWEVNAIFRIFLYNQILDNYLCFQGKMWRFHTMKTQWGFSKLLSLECLRDPRNGFIVDDNCVFGAEVAVIKTQRVAECVSLAKVSGPFKRDWKISDFSKLKGIWYSEEFIAGDQKWKVKLYPDGNGSQKDKSVSVFLDCVDSKSFASHEKLKAVFRLSIKNQLNINHHSQTGTSWFTSSKDEWGFNAFIPLSDMRDPEKGFIVNDCCIVEAEICVGALTRDATGAFQELPVDLS